jgi:hypothetical protein
MVQRVELDRVKLAQLEFKEIQVRPVFKDTLGQRDSVLAVRREFKEIPVPLELDQLV